MCGIVGIIGKDAARKVINSLKILEYRGYDSAGIAVMLNGRIEVRKAAGTIENLISRYPDILEMRGELSIGHTRWATHGKVSDSNAHPITDCSRRIAVVHNGTIDNYMEIRERLSAKHEFRTETDTEVIAHLIEEKLNRGLGRLEAFVSAISELRGEYAVACMFEGANELYLARNRIPLVIGVGEGENYCASDVIALLNLTNKFIYVNDGEFALITSKNIDVWRFEEGRLIPVEKRINLVDWSPSMTSKGKYEHFMLKEIFEQEDVVKRILMESRRYIKGALSILEETMKNGGRIIFLAAGTSYHASMVGKYLLNSLLGYPSEVSIASEFTRWNLRGLSEDDLVIAVSQSGETADVLMAVKSAKEKGAKILSFVNVPGSTLSRESDEVFFFSAGPEIGVAATKTYVAELVSFLLTFTELGKITGDPVHHVAEVLPRLPSIVASCLESSNRIAKALSEAIKGENSIFFMGRGINYPTALEGALKMKEISYIHAEGFPAGEYKHGPLALISEGTYSIVIGSNDQEIRDLLLSNVNELKARGSKVISVETDEHLPSDIRIKVAENGLPEEVLPVVFVIPLQLLAYYTAVTLGRNPDKPRNLAKSVTVK
ncbi:MAG: glutamine--fructose-6-phosphate transaminase (isomerizing) [Candidatus Methanodesulfokora sp.]|jgi:glucosamine--fructose-6-phosphate aminotransferase (isomerizing)